MAKPKVDFKQVLLQHGERIGIGIAGALAGLMVVMSLFWPGSGIFSGSPSEKASSLSKVTQPVEQQLNDTNNLPKDEHKPEKDADKKRVALEQTKVDTSGKEVKALVSIDGRGQMGRRLPKVYPIDEGIGRFAHMQVQSYIFDDAEPPKIYALRVADRPGLGNTQLDRMRRILGQGAGGGARGRLGGGPGGAGGPGGGNLGGFGGGMRGGMGMGEGGGFGGPPGMTGPNDKQDRELVPIPINKLDSEKSVKLAEQVRPLRMVIIGGSFPYKQQVEEFRTKLGMRYVNEVLSEQSQETTDGQPMPSFRFTGVKVERRELDGDGKPVSDFQEIDLNKTYRPYVVLTGRRFEPEDQELRNFGILVDGLAMPRLMQFREENVHSGGMGGMGGMPGMGGMGPPAPGGPGGKMGEGGPGGMEGPGGHPRNTELDKYPSVEKELPMVQKALREMKGKNINEVAKPPEFLSGDSFDVWNSRPDSPAMGGGGFGTGEGPGMGGPPGAGKGGPPTGGKGGPPRSSAPPGGYMMGGRPGPGEGGPGGFDPNQQTELAEHCLVRLVDVTVQPGKTYEYRLAVKMANPNFGRRDVASPDYAKDKEIISEWAKSTIKVTVEPEMAYYAVNQLEWEQTADDGNKRYILIAPHRNEAFYADKQVWLQAHRWLENVKLKGGASRLEFGEWTIAERFAAYRGEYAGKVEHVEAPVWRTTREAFVIASDASTTQRKQGIGVYFGYAPDETRQPESLVVDFDNGEHGVRRVVSRTDEDVKTQPVSEKCGKEVLMMRPDGRLMLLDGARDFNNEERLKRIDAVRKRILTVKQKEAMGGNRMMGPGGRGPGGTGGGAGSPDG